MTIATTTKPFANPSLGHLSRASASVHVLGLAVLLLGCSDDGPVAETSDPAPVCVAPPFDPDDEAAWSFCGCGEEDSKVWARCAEHGGRCAYSKTYTDTDFSITGSACQPACRTDADCVPQPGWVQACYESACVLTTIEGEKTCPDGWALMPVFGCLPVGPGG